jgi:hypothetical protein
MQMAAFQEILDVLPGRLQTLDFSDVQELRLRVGQAPAVLENGRERRASWTGFCSARRAIRRMPVRTRSGRAM